MADAQFQPAASQNEPRRGLNDLLNGVVGADAAVKDGVLSAHAQVMGASADLREAVARLHRTEDEAWRRYGADVDRAVAQMETELSSAEAQLRVEQADSRDQLSAALQQVAETWRARADEVRLQILLGEMEARDAASQSLDALDRAGHRVVALVEELRHNTAASMSSLRDRTRDVVDDVRQALRGVAIAFRSDSDDSSENDPQTKADR